MLHEPHPTLCRFPAPVERFRKQVREADAILIGHPEYNFSIAAPMKVQLPISSLKHNPVLGLG